MAECLPADDLAVVAVTALQPALPDNWTAAYIGRPWVWRGMTETGVDCWSLVCRVWSDIMHVTLPTLLAPTSHDGADTLARNRLIARVIAKGETLFDPLDTPRPLSIARILHKSQPVHVGLYVKGGHILHASEAHGSVVLSRVSDFGPRISGYYWPSAALLKAQS